jgi:hypothetical protein
VNAGRIMHLRFNKIDWFPKWAANQ